MIKSFIKTVGAVTLTVLFFSEQAIADNSNQCMALYNSVKSAYTDSDFDDYQKEAIEAWIKRGCCGIYEKI